MVKAIETVATTKTTTMPQIAHRFSPKFTTRLKTALRVAESMDVKSPNK
jgi:hypothetical protein